MKWKLAKIHGTSGNKHTTLSTLKYNFVIHLQENFFGYAFMSACGTCKLFLDDDD